MAIREWYNVYEVMTDAHGVEQSRRCIAAYTKEDIAQDDAQTSNEDAGFSEQVVYVVVKEDHRGR